VKPGAGKVKLSLNAVGLLAGGRRSNEFIRHGESNVH